MRRNLKNTFHALLRFRLLVPGASALLLTSGASTVHAQSLRNYTLLARPQGITQRVAAPLQLERYQVALNFDPSLATLAPLAPIRVSVPTRSNGAAAQTVVSKARPLECPMRVARTDSSRSSGMPVSRADTIATRLDIGGTIVGCSNPLAR